MINAEGVFTYLSNSSNLNSIFLKKYIFIIANNSQFAFAYSINILRGRFKLGERAIARSGYISYLYARDIIKGRFELGEEAISKSAECSCKYAEEVLDERFKLGEEVIRTHLGYRLLYEDAFGVRL
jgi:hypothetical protein